LTPHTFSPLFLTGAPALALWIYVRWPRLTPSKLINVLLHVGAATAAAVLCRGAVASIADSGSVMSALVAVFAVALPILVYVLLTALWMMTALRSAAFRGH
jgi:hypothetical protein